MSDSTTALGGKEWAALGISAGAAVKSSVFGWDALLPHLARCPAGQDESGHAARLAAVFADAAGDPTRAAAALRGGDFASALNRWSIFQLALQTRSRELLDQWVLAEKEHGAHEEGDLSALFDWALFLLFGDREIRAAAGQPAVGDVARLANMVRLMALERLEDCAALLDPESPALSLVAAHWSGDVAGDRARQAEIAGRMGEAAPLMSAEILLELAAAGIEGQDVERALTRRLEVLGGMEGFQPDVSATVMALKLRAPGHAVDHEQTLRNPQILLAWQHLENLARRLASARQPAQLAQQYLGESEGARSPLFHVLRLRAAELLMSLGKWPDALNALSVRFDGQLHKQLASIYRLFCNGRTGAWDGVSEELLEHHVDLSRPVQADLALQLATISAMALPDRGHALERIPPLLAKLGEASVISGATSCLVAAIRQVGDLDRLGRLWSALIRMAGNDEARRFCCFAQGVADLHTGKIDSAVKAFAQDDQGEAPAMTLAALSVAHAARKRWPDTIAALQKLASTMAGDSRVAVLREAAHLAVVKARSPEQGAALLAETLELKPEDHDLHLEAAAINMGLKRYAEVIRHLEGAVDPAADVHELADLMYAIGQIHAVYLSDNAAAEKAYSRALEVHPLHPASLRGLCLVLRAEGRLRDLPPHMRSLLTLVQTDKARLKLLHTLSELHLKLWETDHDLGDAKESIAFSEKILGIDPSSERAQLNILAIRSEQGQWQEIITLADLSSTSPEVLRALQRACQETERWGKFAQASRRLAEVLPDLQEQVNELMRAGDVYQGKLGDHTLAEECFRLAIDNIQDAETTRRLSRLLRAQDRPADLAAALELELACADRDAVLELHRELGPLYDGLQDTAQAIRHYEMVVKAEPDNPATLRRLEALLDREQRHAEQARVLERLLTLAKDDPAELPIMIKLGGVYEQLSDEQSTLRTVSRIQRRFRNDRKAFEFAEGVFSRLGRHAELCGLYERRIESLQGKPDARSEISALLHRKGTIELEQMGSLAQAVESLTRVIEINPRDTKTLELLERVLSGEGDWQRLMTVFEKHANSLEKGQDQLASLHRAASLAAEQLHDESEAQRLYERIHSIDSTDARSFAFLEHKLEMMNDSKRLAELLVERSRNVPDVLARVGDILRAASIYRQISAGDEAIELYRSALELDPNNYRAMEALSQIYESLERWEEFLEITRRQIQLVTKKKVKAMLYFKCGSVVETKFKKLDEAATYYENAISTSKKCLPALHSLRELHARRKDWNKVVETLQIEATVWSDAMGKADILSQVAEVFASKLEDPAMALEFYKRAIKINPHNMRAALALFEATASQGKFEESLTWGQIYAKKVRVKGSQTQQAEFFVRWAGVLHEVGRHHEAAKHLVKALGINSSLRDALFGLLAICCEAPESYDFSAVFSDLIKDASKREDSLATAILSTSMGQLAANSSDIDLALELFERGVKTAGNLVQLVVPYANFLVLLGREQDAVSLVEASQRESQDSFPDWIKGALWLIDHEVLWRMDFSKAAGMCQEVLKEQPNQLQVRERLARTLHLLGKGAESQVEHELICTQLERLGSDPVRLGLAYQSHGLAAQQAGSQDAARGAFHRASELHPSWPYPRISLARLDVTAGNLRAAEERTASLVQVAVEDRADQIRFQACLQESKGLTDYAGDMYRQLVDQPNAAPEDRVKLTRLLISAGKSEQAESMLVNAMRGDPDYIPAVDELHQTLMTEGDGRRAARVARVLGLYTGATDSSRPSVGSMPQVPAAFWARNAEGMTNPIESLWRIIVRSLERQKPGDRPRGAPCSSHLAQAVMKELNESFGVKLEAFQVDRMTEPVWRLVDSQLFIWPEVEELGLLRFVAAMALSGARSGHGWLFRLDHRGRLQLAQDMGNMLAGKPPSSLQGKELGAGLSRKEQKEVARLLASHNLPAHVVEMTARDWLSDVFLRCTKAALLVTDDISSPFRLMGLERGLRTDLLAGEELLPVFPELSHVVEHYLSDTFDEAWQLLES